MRRIVVAVDVDDDTFTGDQLAEGITARLDEFYPSADAWPVVPTRVTVQSVTEHRRRPNRNPVLAVTMRDAYDPGDPWGTAMSVAFAVCEVLTYLDRSDLIPSSLGYSPSMGGVDVDDYTFAEVLALTATDGMVDGWTPATVDELGTAARCLSLYLDLCRLAGRDY